MLSEHAARVDAWLRRSGKQASPPELLRLFGAAHVAVWARSLTTLGEVTLTAIADRVLYTAAAKYPAFSTLRVDPTLGIQCAMLGERAVAVAVLREGLRFVLVEFLTVIGTLTDEILTPELHSALAKVAAPKAGRVKRQSSRKTTDAAGEGQAS